MPRNMRSVPYNAAERSTDTSPNGVANHSAKPGALASSKPLAHDKADPIPERPAHNEAEPVP